MEKIQTECSTCNGTGLYCGCAEPPETAVICLTCGGTGCETIRYKPFTHRKRKRGIKQVICDKGPWFARDPNAVVISTKDFYKQK